MMNNQLQNSCVFLLAMGICFNSYADAGPLVTVTGTGGEGPVAVNIWLNGDGPLSGQQFTVTGGYNVTITPTILNHTYPAMGLEVLTPGLTVTNGCSRYVGDRCIFSASHDQPTTLPISPTNQAHYIFETSTQYDGDLGGVGGADAICNTVAHASGNPNINTLSFKSLIVGSTRYPCDNTGMCGGAHSSGWPLLPNTQYLNPDNTSSINHLSNSNAVFPQPNGVTTQFQNENGQNNNNEFWIGIQSILLDNADTANIIGWAYANVNPASSQNYINFFATCVDWTSNDNANFGNLGMATAASSNVTITTSPWGNYHIFTDVSSHETVSSWNNSVENSCDGALSLICVS